MDDLTPAAPKAVSYPPSVVLGGVEYRISDTPELQNFITAVGSVERSKIQSVVRDLRTKLENLPNPAPATVNTAEIAEAVMAAIRPQLDTITERLNSTEKESVASYREKMVAQLGESVIPELILGTTKEAIDASVATAKAARSRYNISAPAAAVAVAPAGIPVAGVPVEAINIANPQTIISTAPAANVAPTLIAAPVAVVTPLVTAPQVPAVPARATPDYSGPNIAAMNMGDFGSNRDALFQQLQSLVP